MLLGLLIIVIGSILWGLIAFFFGRIVFGLGLLIGLVITVALAYTFDPITRILRVFLFLPSILATLASMLLGEYMATVLLVTRELHYPLFESALVVASKPEIFLNSGNTIIGAIFCLIGSVASYLAIMRHL